MPFDLPSYDETRELILAAMSGRRPSTNVSQRSTIYKLFAALALGLTDSNHNIRQVGLDVIPDTAEDELLDRWANIFLGPNARKGATGASKSAALRVFGTSGATVPVNEELKHLPSGLLFETRSGGTIPASGFLDVDVEATSTGEVTNLEVSQEISFTSTPAGLKTAARIVIELEGGLDQEKDDALRPRMLNRIAQPAAGGNRNDYEQFLLEAGAFVATGYVYPNRIGLGTVDLAALKSGTGSARLLTASQRAQLLNVIDPIRPIDDVIRILEVVALPTDVEALIIPESDPSFTFDWDDSTPPTLMDYNGPTRTLTFNADRPASMDVGDRLIFSTGDGSQSVIESLVSTDAVVIVDAISFTPQINEPIYSGGPLVDDVRNAVIDLFDALGPANPDANRYGPWEGNLRLSNLFEAIQTSDGVLDSTIVTPAANVAATDFQFPNDAQIELLTPGQILIRRDPS